MPSKKINPVFFSIPANIYCTCYRDVIIVLNTISNEYIILSKELCTIYTLLLEKEFFIQNNKFFISTSDKVDGIAYQFNSEELNEYINNFLRLGLISRNSYRTPKTSFLHKDKSFSGISDVNWKLKLNNNTATKIPKKLVLEAFCTLFKVSILVKLGGFFSLIKYLRSYLKKSDDKQENLLEVKNSYQTLEKCARALEKALFYFPIKTKCLEWSAALVLMGLERKIKCNLVVGVQNTPFFAHAWVEINNKVIADSSQLSKELAILLIEPYKFD